MLHCKYVALQKMCQLITSRISIRANRIGPVFLPLCQLVSALTAKPFDVQTQIDIGIDLDEILDNILDDSRGQRSRSQGQISGFSDLSDPI